MTWVRHSAGMAVSLGPDHWQPWESGDWNRMWPMAAAAEMTAHRKEMRWSPYSVAEVLEVLDDVRLAAMEAAVAAVGLLRNRDSMTQGGWGRISGLTGPSLVNRSRPRQILVLPVDHSPESAT